MKSVDYSKEIYENFFDPKGGILKITLINNSVLYGIFVSVFHGDQETDEPFIIKWHFLTEDEILKNKNQVVVDMWDEQGTIINQEDIREVAFK